MPVLHERSIAVGVACLLLCSAAIAQSSYEAVQPLPEVQCLVVDSDSNIDDIRALAILGQYYRIAAVITSAGMQDPSTGAATLARFLATAAIQTTVIQGRSRSPNTSPHPEWTWLTPARNDMNRIDAALAKIRPSDPQFAKPKNDSELADLVDRTTKDCEGIGHLVLGPWSSFDAYRGFVDRNGEPAKFVLSQGRSINDPDLPDWDRVNCKFDITSCQTAIRSLPKNAIAWVDLPGPGHSFPVNKTLLDKLGATQPSLALKEVMGHAAILEPQEQWDDMPAIFLLHPEAFKREGQHIIPARSPQDMAEVEVQLLNGQRERR